MNRLVGDFTETRLAISLNDWLVSLTFPLKMVVLGFHILLFICPNFLLFFEFKNFFITMFLFNLFFILFCICLQKFCLFFFLEKCGLYLRWSLSVYSTTISNSFIQGAVGRVNFTLLNRVCSPIQNKLV